MATGHARFWRWVVLVFVVVQVSTLMAQSQAPVPPQRADPPVFSTTVVVTPERGETPGDGVTSPTTVIDRQAVAQMPVVNAPEVLTYVPGFHVSRSAFYAGVPVVSSRGFFGGGEVDYFAFLVDGVRTADAESGLADWSGLVLTSIRRLEATRGPGGAMYGDSSVGGVVQVLTDGSRPRAQALFSVGSFKTLNAQGTVSGRRGTTTAYVSAGAQTTDGAFEHSAATQYSGDAAIEGRGHGLDARWTIGASRTSRDDPGPLARDVFRQDPRASSPLYGDDHSGRTRFATSLSLGGERWSWKPKLTLHLDVRHEDRVRTIELAPSIADSQDRTVAATTGGATAEAERNWFDGALTTRVGAEFRRSSLDTSYRPVGAGAAQEPPFVRADGTRVEGGAFALASWQTTRARLTAAMRGDFVRDSGFDAAPGESSLTMRSFSPRVGAVVRVSDAGSIDAFGQASLATKVPTLDQRYDPRPYPDFAGGTFTISNGRLEPQSSASVEGGLSGGGSRWRWSAVTYRLDLRDEIDFDVSSFRYANLGKSVHVGLETEASVGWPGGHRIGASYTLTRARQVGVDGQLKNVPRHQLGVTLALNLPWSGSALVRFSQSMGAYLDDVNVYKTRGPANVDLRIRRRLGPGALFVDVLNAFGRTYEEFGFTLTDFRGRDVPFVYAGAPRALRFGFTLGL